MRRSGGKGSVAAKLREKNALDQEAALGEGYKAESKRPMAGLMFVLPGVLAYELGVQFLTPVLSGGVEQRIVANTILRDFFMWFDMLPVIAGWLSAVVVVVSLLMIQWFEDHPWKVSRGTLWKMGVESLAWAVPLVGLSFLAVRQTWLLAGTEGQPGAQGVNLILLSIGAGIYEELVFRLMGFAALSWLFMSVFKWPKGVAMIPTLVMTSVGFSLYHYLSAEQFDWGTAAFRLAAGFYFGVLFLKRGFGITAGSHAAYDVIISCIYLSKSG